MSSSSGTSSRHRMMLMLLQNYKSVGSLSADSSVKSRDVSYRHKLESPVGLCPFDAYGDNFGGDTTK
ncbi:hypothetical protein OXX69_012643 [Metschnikowia pulcherrima]